MQVKRRVVHVPPDPASLVNPVLAAVSDRLREKWKESGLGLVALAEEINFLFDDMGGFNKDNLLRVLHGGYKRHNGITSPQVFYSKAKDVAAYFRIDRKQLVEWMGAEKLRRFVLGKLIVHGAAPSDFVGALEGIVDESDIQQLIAWLEQRPYSVSLDGMAGAIAEALNQLCSESFLGKNIREFLADIQNGV